MGVRIANGLMSSNILDYLDLSQEFSIVEIKVSDRMANQTLIDLDLRSKYGANVVAIKRGETVMISLQADELIEKGDYLVVIGENDDLDRLERAIHKVKN